MSAADKIAFAKAWYAKGVCPGCGMALEAVFADRFAHGSRNCSWANDDLTSLVLIATDFGRATA